MNDMEPSEDIMPSRRRHPDEAETILFHSDPSLDTRATAYI